MSTRIPSIVLSGVIGVMSFASESQAVQYDFLPIAQNSATTSTFSSLNGNGTIGVSQVFSAGGAGTQNNQNTAIFPSQFTTLFPGTGQVQGHLAQTVYNHTSTVTFDLTNYNLTPSTVFGIWNITDEVTANPGTPFVYRVEVEDSSATVLPPSTWSFIGRQDNQTQVSGRHELSYNLSNGDLFPGASLGGSVHTDAIFFDQLILSTGTKKIMVTANLPPLNPIGDGVGYYFAEVRVPEPTTACVLLAGASVLRVDAGRESRMGADPFDRSEAKARQTAMASL